jgi:SagB-type dehydrogenase family enzyme
VVAITGFIADFWDLNDFLLHTVSGYVMAVLAAVHTAFELPLLLRYVRRRLVVRPAPRASNAASVDVRQSRESEPSERDSQSGQPAASRRLTRRGLFGLLVGGAGGFLLGRTTAPVEVGLIENGEAAETTGGDLGLIYHAWSKAGAANAGAGDLLGGLSDWGSRPEPFKVYPQAERVRLPAPEAVETLTAFDAIEQRRSIRDYAQDPMALADLSRLLYLTDGITEPRGAGGFRASPSAGALYPIETYVIAHRVTDLAAGLYHYDVRDHALARLRSGDLRQEAVRLGLMQGFLGEANVVLVLTAIFQRLRWRYRRRSYRYALLEAGHIGQNVYLAATSMGMGACAVGAFLDGGLNDLLAVDGEREAALYMLAVGRVY